ncbi:MAG: Predicted Fe-Mo cluster-binding protein, NifX family [Candidatus Kentron sp. G]|nr:MAG: Predicted Fe-Mo cluster-binding protein, NifX family [Candidatus Kentron sp. G]VFN04795.1 MAG: Predicted Fe-Mo cluster-binding protein, NifX family [Candidatus Kentron sp. G]VFN05998.1 MAG: Predicted Fe-Mo cluster-binding protein, NifX family [Candidatus Kentron sp. G]
MKIAVPVANQTLCAHFGHCETFAMFDVDEEKKTIERTENHRPPPHEPGVLPKWIGEQGVGLVLAGGLGAKARELLNGYGVKVVVGVSETNPEQAVMDYLQGNLETGSNTCDH